MNDLSKPADSEEVILVPSTQVLTDPALLLAGAVLGLLRSHPNPEEAIAACRIAVEVLGLKVKRGPEIRINTKINESSPA